MFNLFHVWVQDGEEGFLKVVDYFIMNNVLWTTKICVVNLGDKMGVRKIIIATFC